MRALSTETDTDNGTKLCNVQGDAQRKTRRIVAHMQLFSTGLDLRIWCGSLPSREPREFLVSSPALVQLGYPRCSVSSRQSRELRPCSPSTKLGTCCE